LGSTEGVIWIRFVGAITVLRMETDDSDETDPDLTRRRALKTGVAGVGAAIVWSEPTIRGLVKRPAYAAAATTF